MSEQKDPNVLLVAVAQFVAPVNGAKSASHRTAKDLKFHVAKGLLAYVTRETNKKYLVPVSNISHLEVVDSPADIERLKDPPPPPPAPKPAPVDDTFRPKGKKA